MCVCKQCVNILMDLYTIVLIYNNKIKYTKIYIHTYIHTFSNNSKNFGFPHSTLDHLLFNETNNVCVCAIIVRMHDGPADGPTTSYFWALN